MILQRRTPFALEAEIRKGYRLCVAQEQTTIQTEELLKVLADRIGQLETENIALKLALARQEQIGEALRSALEASVAPGSDAVGD